MTRTTEGDTPLVDAVRAGDAGRLQAAIETGAPVSARGEDGWSALDWAAGRGDVALITRLLAAGAAPDDTGPDGRRPYEIALAASHRPAAEALRAHELSSGLRTLDDYRWEPYCRAYPLDELRRFPAWAELATEPDDGPADGIVFVHHDLTVTASMWHGSDVIVGHVTEDWARFAHDDLDFSCPDDLDLLPEPDDGTGAGTETGAPPR